MKTKLLYSFLFLGVYLFGFALENTPKVDFSSFEISVVEFTTNPVSINNVVTICAGGIVVFTDASENLDSDAQYLWNFEGGSILASSALGPHEIQYNTVGTYTASLTIDGTIKTVNVEVIPAPEVPTLAIENSATSGYSTDTDGSEIQFLRCGNYNFGNFDFVDPNQDTYPEGTTFEINWGDGSQVSNQLETHLYNPGMYTLTYSVIYPGNCVASSDFSIYVGNEPPTITIFNSGSMSCKPNEYDFTIAASNDLPGTIYEINVNDGSAPIILNGLPSNPYTLTHVFEDTSCGATSIVNNTTYNDAFSIQVTAYNPCSSQGSFTSVGPVRVSESTEPDFTMSNTTACVNNEITLQDITNPGASATQGGCSIDYGMYWEIIPATGFTITEGNLGSNNGFTEDTYDWNEWTNGSGNLDINFNEPGNYEFILHTGNNCSEEIIVKNICVAPEINAEFELNENESCFSNIFVVQNTSSLPGCNQEYLYQWNVTANTSDCEDEVTGTTSWNFVNGTSQSSENPEIEFTEPGNYTLELVLNTDGQNVACETDTFSQQIFIKDTPETTLVSQSVCIDEEFQLSALVTNCFADEEANYFWDFTNIPASIQSSTLAQPTLSLNEAGVFEYTLALENECGIASFTGSITVLPQTEVSINAPEEVCENQPINLQGVVTGATTTGVWSVSVEGGTFQENENILDQIYIPAENFVGTIEFTLTSTSEEPICENLSESILVEVQPEPEISIIADNYSCLNEDITLTAQLGGSATEVTWSSNVAGSFSDVNALETIFTVPANYSGEIEITATSNNPEGTCEAAEVTTTVNILPIPEMQNVSDIEVCNTAIINEIEFLAANTDYETHFSWEFAEEVGAGQITGFGNIPSFTAQNLTEDSFTTQVTVTPFFEEEDLICEGTPETFNITIHPAPLVNNISLTYCETASIDFSPEDYNENYIPAGTTYTWELPQGNENQAIEGTSASVEEVSNFSQNLNQVINQETTLIYQVTPHLGNCEGAIFYVEIYFPAQPEINDVNLEVCSGEAVALDFTELESNLIPQNTLFTWEVNDSANATGATSQNEATSVFEQTLINQTSENQNVIYTVYPEHENCSGQAFQVEILVKPSPIVDDFSLEICSGDEISFPMDNQQAVFPANTQFTWQVEENSFIDGAVPNQELTSQIQHNLTSTSIEVEEVTYIVTPWFDGCIGEEFELSVVVNSVPTIEDINLSVCTGGSFSLSTEDYFAGMVPNGTQFTWDYPTGENIDAINGATAQSTPTNSIEQELTNTTGELTSIVYSITPETVTCIGESFLLNVQIENSGEIAQQPEAYQQICVDGVADPLAVELEITSESTTYQWFTNSVASTEDAEAISGETSPILNLDSFNEEGNYFYFVQISPQGNECGDVISEFSHIEVVAQPNVEITTNQDELAYCQNAEASLLIANASNGIGDFNFQWWVSPSTNFSDATLLSGENQSEMTPFTNEVGNFYYFVEVSQANSGCSNISEAVQVQVYEQPEITLQPQPIVACLEDNSQEIVVEVNYQTGNASYQWYVSENADLSNASAVEGAQQANLLPNTSQVGEAYYYVEIEFDNASCNTLTSEAALVETIVAPELEVIPDVELCVGEVFESIQFSSLTENMLTTYTWTNSNPNIGLATSGNNSIPSFIVENNTEVTQVAEITVTATSTFQSQSCGVSTQTFNITVSAPIQANPTFSDFNGVNTRCETSNEAYILLNPNGGLAENMSDYEFLWTGPDNFTSTQQDIYNLNAGLYQLEITDNAGCAAYFEYEVIAPEALVIQENLLLNILCNGDATGMIDVEVTGGIGNYTYYWEKDGAVYSTQEDLSNLEAGHYELTVFDENVCFASQAFEINEPQTLNVELVNSGGATCYGEESSGFINIEVTGGVPLSGGNANYDYQWTNANGFESSQEDLENLSPGIYNLIVTDQVGCSVELEVEIEQPDELVINYDVTLESCTNAEDASINIDVSGGVAPYNINWESGEGSTRRLGLSSGTYIVTVTDANGCEQTQEIVISSPASYEATLTASNLTCYEANDGMISLEIIPEENFNPTNLVFNWTGPNGYTSNLQNLVDLEAGYYEVEISNTDSCIQTFGVEVNQPSQLEASYFVENASCNGAQDGELIVQVEGGTAPYFSEYGEFNDFISIENPQVGNYEIEIMDSNACEIFVQVEITDEVLFEIPAPEGNSYQQFCIEDQPLVSDLRATGLEVIWFADYALTEELSPFDELKQGETYFGVNYNSEYGCMSREALEVTVEVLDGNLEVNNLITVNGNNLNARMKIVNIKRFPENKVSIFNRYGKLVWEADHYDNAHVVFKGIANVDGTVSKNQALPTGAYYYVLQFSSPCGFKTKKGFIQIDNNL